MSSYEELTLMTPLPVSADPKISILCAPDYSQHLEIRGSLGPHARSEIKVYMDSSAAEALRNQRVPYPVGAVIVKEKLQEDSTVQQPAGIGGMVKRSPGFDPENGDWEYFYSEAPDQIDSAPIDSAPIDSGPIESCVACHQGAKKTDYVFGSWRRPLTTAALPGNHEGG